MLGAELTTEAPFFFQSPLHFAALCVVVYVAQRLVARVRRRRSDTSASRGQSSNAGATSIGQRMTDITPDPDAVEALVVLGYRRREAIAAVTSHGQAAS